ncbi:hypothetical protein ABI_01810 [Asticcacaulis biprosthecium C19]|uniref:DUF4386 domain-containing protein n=1 Tax=Asticcacaulis biprosthecium C19 TaxID=715226 RepID=F4QIB3_9CAUL|nr:DUF4386 domain-containing protein [Asticcacaulis biprosthecium]EGF91751.1 hypothetical protein ABI_01810 [Asticcacaulis biprosthecium C19]
MTISLKSTARMAGFMYLAASLTGAFNLLYVPSQLFVMDDPQATLAKIMSSEILFRQGIVGGVVSGVLFLALPVVLYSLLESFGRIWAGLMVAFAAVGVGMAFVGTQAYLGVLALVDGAGGPGDGPLALQVMDHIHAHHQAESVASIFWGLWLLPLGWLIVKSRAMPRFLGVLLLLGCTGYLANFLLPLLVPGYSATILPYLVVIPGAFGELGTCLWLLIFGLRNRPGEV